MPILSIDHPATIPDLLKAARFGWWDLDLITQTLTASAACKRNFGRPENQPFTYAQLAQSVHPEDFVDWRNKVEAAISHRGVFDLEYRAICPDKTIRSINVQGTCTPETDSVGPRMAGISRDLTALRTPDLSWHPFSEALVMSSHFIALFDLAGRAYYANPTALQWSGASSLTEFGQRTLAESFPAAERSRVNQDFIPQVLKGGSGSIDTVYLAQNGSAQAMRFQLAVLREGKRPIALATISQALNPAV